MYNINVAPIPATDYCGPLGAAGGEFAELAAFPGYQTTLGPGQSGQFTLPFATTGIDDGNSGTWQFSMPQVSFSCDLGGTPIWCEPSSFGTPTVTLVETPEPSTLALLGVAGGCAVALAWRRRRATDCRVFRASSSR